MKQKVSSANNQVEIIKLTSNAISVDIQNLAKVLKKEQLDTSTTSKIFEQCMQIFQDNLKNMLIL